MLMEVYLLLLVIRIIEEGYLFIIVSVGYYVLIFKYCLVNIIIILYI